LTVKVPENAKPLITIPADAWDADPAAGVVATAGEGAGAFAAVGYDELHAASKMDTAAPAAIAYGFITVTTHEGQTWFSVRRPDLVQCDLAMPATRTPSP
jgi:hypothetical protein